MKKKEEVPLWVKPSTLVWVEIRDKTGIDVLEYLPATVSSFDSDNGTITVRHETEQTEEEVAANLIHERLAEHGIVSDLADIPILNDAELLKHLEIRYLKDMIYCYCGPTLIAVNPYKACPHEESPEKYKEIIDCLVEGTVSKAPPHVWTISATAYDYCFKFKQNQAVCISGESGAGKTESTKRCLAFITQLNKKRKSENFVPIEQKIMACNPILEAFGNSKTFRNDNSSRFGKYTTLFIHKGKKSIEGASIENYLLEKSRVVKLGPEERNYHIFYAMCRYFPLEKLKEYKLVIDDQTNCEMEDFFYLNQSGVYSTPKVNDEEFYNDDLEFTKDEIDGVWRILSAILHLGNVQIDDSCFIEGSKPCQIIKSDRWDYFCEMMQCDPDKMAKALTNKLFKMRGQEDQYIPLKPDMVKAFLNSLSKELYNKMFDWIVMKLNGTLLPTNKNDPNFLTIGVLDIFGFEIFEKNSLEQFFINYANERLQALYIQYIFKNECDIFREEGLEKFISLIKFKDNGDLLKALDSDMNPPGIFALTNEACQLSKDDKYLYNGIKSANKKQEHISFNKRKKAEFIVKHTARDVEYCVDGFVEKNKDEISPLLEESIQGSNKAIVDIYIKGAKAKENSEKKPARGRGGNSKYLGIKFKSDMDNLINQLSKCYCHFVRCIKPNEFKKANHWNSHLALMQVRYMGLLDSLKIRKQSFPFRFQFQKFYEIYQDLDLGENGSISFNKLVESGANFKQLSSDLIQQCGLKVTDNDLLYGKTRLFLNSPFKIELDKELLKIQKNKIQSLKNISSLYKTFRKKVGVKEFFKRSYNSICISRDLLKSWTAKIEGMRFRNFLKITRQLQSKFRLIQSKRQLRLKSHNMKIIAKYLALYKFSKQISYISYYRRKILMLQAMMDRQIKDGKNRFCKQLVNKVFEDAWAIINARIVEQSVLNIQKSYRAHMLRNIYKNEYSTLTKKIKDSIKFNAVVTIQKIIRGFLVRKRLDKLNRATFKIQGYFRTVWMSNYFKQMRKSAKIIQKAYRKFYTKKQKIDEKMNSFLEDFGQYNQEVNQIEHTILFGNTETLTSLENIETYTKLPFFLNDSKINFGSENYKKFIPKSLEIELNPRVKFMSLLVDVSINVDTTNIYPNTWSHEFMSFLKKVHKKNNRLLHLEIGETFTMAITEDKEVYSWGLNDFNQCGRFGPKSSFSIEAGVIKNISANNTRFLAAGKDHSVMVDDYNNIYTWGRNADGQLGLEHARSTDCIYVLNNIKEDIVNLKAKGNNTYILTKSGSVIKWPHLKEQLNKYSPEKISIPMNTKIASLSLGSGFAMFLATSGLVFSSGRNNLGQLGLGHEEITLKTSLIRFLKEKNEKVIEIHCGYGHTICRTALNKIYTWGLNQQGQLGLSGSENTYDIKSIPNLLHIPEYKGFRYKPRSISAGLYCSFILMDDRRIFQMGITGKENVRIPGKFKFEKKFFGDRMTDDFTPLRVFCKWSKLMTATYILFVDFRKCNISKTVREKFVKKINETWNNNSNQILPTHDDLLAKYVWYKYLQKPGKRFAPNFEYSGQTRIFNQTHEHNQELRSKNSERTIELNNKPNKIIKTGIDWDSVGSSNQNGEEIYNKFKNINYIENENEIQRFVKEEDFIQRSSLQNQNFEKEDSAEENEEMIIVEDEREMIDTEEMNDKKFYNDYFDDLRNKKKGSPEQSPEKSVHSQFSNELNLKKVSKKSNIKKNSSKKSPKGVTFQDPKLRGSKEINSQIYFLKNKKNLTPDEKKLLEIYEKMRK